MEILKEINYASFVKRALFVFIGTMLLAISSKIKIPFYPVPMTMQTFVVLFIGIAFGWKLGLTTIFLYLLEGMIGLPVFSGTPEKGIGIIYFTGPTMGYLIGFVVTVFLAGYMKYNKNLFLNFIKLSFATSFIYIFGIIWLGIFIGWENQLFSLGVKPFLFAELFKVLLITFSISKIYKIKKFI
ncbi:MAG: biotin transport system substrate-specific component [Pelagibacterales bacterium]|jgi:biotin transport system substrate-specific component|nr:biotin transport system substrate-specific component [Pelagibacterales bacterium]